jgi:hypothetical protein
MSRPRLYLAALTALLTGFFAFLAGAPATFAQVLPPEPNDPSAVAPATTPSVTVTHGSPLWSFVLVAVVAAVVTVLVLLAVQHRWPSRRSLIAA